MGEIEMPAKKQTAMPRTGSVADLREKKPRAAKQFSGIVKTQMTEPSTSKPKPSARKAAPIKGFAPKDIERLRKTEKRYAASRRAATSSGRDTLYD
ncbi:MAG: hypothetical protein ACLQMH_14595 [Solirubrobacteraceae bacterium]